MRGKKIKVIVTVIVAAAFLFSCVTYTGASPAAREEGAPPQWALDARRWNIIAFGTFPFALLVSTMAVDSFRWAYHANMGFDSDSRRYAPWPLRAAGAIEMSSRQREMTFVYAASLSAALAFTDMLIMQSRRRAELRRIEALPLPAIIITVEPIQEAGEYEDGGEASVP